jgi:pSer/pThr/pTyr-binding forkhead associated (FHA) protein
MQTKVVLTFMDEEGKRREVLVDSRRFTIGCGTDNDLVIDAPDVSRRHAIIESFDEGVFIYDCQTPHGTLLNNSPLGEVAALQSGDLLTFGGTHYFTVRLSAFDNSTSSSQGPRTLNGQHALTSTSRAPSRPVPLNVNARPVVKQQPRRHVGLIISTGIFTLIILVGGLLLLASKKSSSRTTQSINGQTLPEVAPAVRTEASPPEVNNGGVTPSPGDATTVASDELEREAARIVQHMSGDAKAYIFPPEAVRDIRRQVEDFRQSTSLRDALSAMQPAVKSVATQARGEGIEPDLVIYAAVARSSEAGQHPAALARQMLPRLRELRATFGSTDADSSLILIAAETEGVGSNGSHPLLATIRRLVRNTFTERNVWHLREHGGLSDAAYRSVVRTIAVGVIAQDPRRYGVQTEPLVY